MGVLYNEVPKWIFVFLFVGTNIGLFGGYFWHYYERNEFYYLRIMTGINLAMARASAAALNFDCLCILLPICRNLINFLRGSCKMCCKRNIVRQLDKNIAFHKFCAYFICFWSAVHVYAHTFNFELLLDAQESSDDLLQKLSNIGNNEGEVYVNPIRSRDANLILELLKTIAGSTGVIITLALIVMYSSSTETIRRSYFEVFWFTHHLFTIFFIGLMIHGAGGLVRSQINLEEHNPRNCSSSEEVVAKWGEVDGCPMPVFKAGIAKTWYWVLGPLIIYTIERIVRFVRSLQKVEIIKVVAHPSKVIEVVMKKKGFKMNAGEYIFLHCPSISQLEWHPFTLTSCPEEDTFSVHIRVVGDWTKALSKALHGDQGEFRESQELPSLAVDGPFGTASEDIFRYSTDILVGAGIGITPFAAVLKDIWYRHCNPQYQMKLNKVYLFWICPDTLAFEWFSDLLKELETQMETAGKTDLLDYNIYLTRGWDANQALNIVTHDEDPEDVITGLSQKTYYGRPNWDDVFAKVKAQNKGRVGVFFCGPKVLSSTLHIMCNRHSGGAGPEETRFIFNKENF